MNENSKSRRRALEFWYLVPTIRVYHYTNNTCNNNNRRIYYCDVVSNRQRIPMLRDLCMDICIEISCYIK